MKVSENEFPQVILEEQGSTPANPDSGNQKLFIRTSDNKLCRVNSSGSVTVIEGGGSGGSSLDYILITDQKSQNTHGGSFTSGAWRTRDLNTEVSDSGGHASVASNQITLAAGTYVVNAVAPAFHVNHHQIRLYDITNNSVLATGTCELSSDSDYYVTKSTLKGKFTLTGSTVIELQHYAETTFNSYGYGQACNFGNEIYSMVELWKYSE
jgi:hypothetical protein